MVPHQRHNHPVAACVPLLLFLLVQQLGDLRLLRRADLPGIDPLAVLPRRDPLRARAPDAFAQTNDVHPPEGFSHESTKTAQSGSIGTARPPSSYTTLGFAYATIYQKYTIASMPYLALACWRQSCRCGGPSRPRCITNQRTWDTVQNAAPIPRALDRSPSAARSSPIRPRHSAATTKSSAPSAKARAVEGGGECAGT